MIDFNDLVRRALQEGAGDIHLKVGVPPSIRVAGHLQRLGEEIVDEKSMLSIVETMAGKKNLLQLRDTRDIDILHQAGSLCRLRVNIFLQSGTLALSARVIPRDVPILEELGFSDAVVSRMTSLREGLFLVTGPTNAGKSTTIAALIDAFAMKGNLHVVTIEDPVEFLFPRYAKSLVDQRQIGRDTPNFRTAITDTFREDPDIIVIGEMRDPDTLCAAIEAAETGRLVISTFHTASAVSTITRIVSSFSESQRSRIRNALASILKGIVSQYLLPSTDRKTRVLAYESLFTTSAMRKHIRDDRFNQLENVIQLTRGKGGRENNSMADSIAALVKEKRVLYTEIPEEFKKMQM
ncbi:MAG: type IV pili twitching motility protein PilT [Candidatus Wallbacteria bacterium HGW-Wallbacteria-1]|jgi:twitching motility protein PilT|uniref:Type IV pili twitching motility protein PilT n=1 Tax=Candidatus Wallbacteria bacterium HGW-Wallbacteria-1 TaxID=2013854 RepID=A0A2N1PP84_9BACT|nr:MAG: type IV pili twitching motility protein PilT [Candidatus Wallbacteria bacterium HGW-Wallbacteria-1]